MCPGIKPRSGAGSWDVLAAGRAGGKQEMMTELVVLSNWRETGQGLRGRPVGSKGHSLSRVLRVCWVCWWVISSLPLTPGPVSGLTWQPPHQQEPIHLEWGLPTELKQDTWSSRWHAVSHNSSLPQCGG